MNNTYEQNIGNDYISFCKYSDEEYYDPGIYIYAFTPNELK